MMLERTAATDRVVAIEQTPVRPGQNILRRGAEMRAGDVVLARGVGASSRSARRPRFGRVGPRCKPYPGRASRSFRPATSWSSPAKRPGRARSATRMPSCFAPWQAKPARSPPPCRSRATSPTSWPGSCDQALEADLVLVTGGVSAGQRDLVPDTLASLGVRKVFHKINLKPGKPLWFGVAPSDAGGPAALVFGLPGNPVSGLVGFLLFVRPALEAPSGRSPVALACAKPGWRAGFASAATASTYFPARIVPDAESSAERYRRSKRSNWSGSADLRTVAAADGFAVFPAGDRQYAPGEIVGYLPMR